MGEYKTKISRDGRVVLPAALRKELRIEPGDEVILRAEKGEVKLVSRRALIRQLQEWGARLKKPGESIVDEFIAQRRAMWGED